MNCKILHLITGLPTGGAQTSLYNLLVNNDRQRCQHVVVSLMDKGVMGGEDPGIGGGCARRWDGARPPDASDCKPFNSGNEVNRRPANYPGLDVSRQPGCLGGRIICA